LEPPRWAAHEETNVNIEGNKVLILGGFGLVGTAVCRELLTHRPDELIVHSLRESEAEQARDLLLSEAGDTEIRVASGDIFGLVDPPQRLEQIWANLRPLEDGLLNNYLLYQLLSEKRPHIVIDCVNTATAIAYRDAYKSSARLWNELVAGAISEEAVGEMLDSLYIPRLIRHIQILYRGMQDAGTGVYLKVGTSGTGGMGLNVPYTHSEEKPSRVLLSKSAVAGAHSMLLFLMARTPDAPITKEVKPAAAIAWKAIKYGPIARSGKKIHIVDAEPRPLGERFSTIDPEAGSETDEILTTAYIDTGENGIFSLEEFALLTTAEQMEFVTPEEIAQALVFELQGGNTGHDIINALDNAVLGPTYRAGLMRHWALERMTELEKRGDTRSVAFEMLGPPRNSKLLFEAHLLREEYVAASTVRDSSGEEVSERLDRLVRENTKLAREIVSVGIPILMANGELLRGPSVIVPEDVEDEELTPEKREKWTEAGWVDLRPANCERWVERFRTIEQEVQSIPEFDTSSRYLRDRNFWQETIQPGKLVGWILSEEEKGDRFK
jgi:hypothetical protein